MNVVIIVVAIYGAVLSTAGIIWQFLTRRDRVRGRVKVSVMPNCMNISAAGHAGPFVGCYAVNDGEKPVTLDLLYLQAEGLKPSLVLPDNGLPETLEVGQQHRFLASRKDLLALLKKKGLEPPIRCTCIFRSNVGRTYQKKFTLTPAEQAAS